MELSPVWFQSAREQLGDLQELSESFPRTIPIVEIDIPDVLEDMHGTIDGLNKYHDKLEDLGPSARHILIHFLKSLEFAWSTNMLIRSKPLTQRPMALDGPPSISICYASAASLPIEDLFKLLENPTLLHMPSICFREYKQSLIALSTNSSLIGLRRSVQLLKNLLGQREFDSLEFVDIALEVCRWWKQNISQGRKTSSNGIANNPPPALSQAAYSLPTGDYNDPKDEDGRESIAHIGKMICAISKLKIEDGFRYLYAPRYVLGAYIINVTTAFDDPGSRYFRQEAADVLLPRAAPEDPHETEDPGETEDSDSQSCWSEETDQPGEHWKLIPEWDFEDILRPTHTLSVYQLYYLP